MTEQTLPFNHLALALEELIEKVDLEAAGDENDEALINPIVTLLRDARKRATRFYARQMGWEEVDTVDLYQAMIKYEKRLHDARTEE